MQIDVNTASALPQSSSYHFHATMFNPRVTKRTQDRRLSRRKHILLLVGCLLAVLSSDEIKSLRGRFLGSKNIKRTRKDVDSIMKEMGAHQQRAYRMDVNSFAKLHGELLEQLDFKFPTKRTRAGRSPNGDIHTKLRLSAAIRYFSGGSPLDIALSHGIARASVYQSAWGVVDAVNKTKLLSFNANDEEFPSHEEQDEIAKGFASMSAAGFSKISLAVDGMLIWTIQPSAADCAELEMGERLFHCFRKDKFGMVLMAGCDHLCRFRWADIRHPGITSDYLAFSTSKLGLQLEKDGNNIMKPGHTMVGDNAWVETDWMATPIPGHCISETDDAYNFYHSQIRITVERVFGIFVHRWGILRRPLGMSILKVPALVTCLMKLHNFCINNSGNCTPSTLRVDERAIRNFTARSSRISTVSHSDTAEAVRLNEHGSPDVLTGAGHHFLDLARQRRPTIICNEITPMHEMRESVALQGLRRPLVNKEQTKKRKRNQ